MQVKCLYIEMSWKELINKKKSPETGYFVLRYLTGFTFQLLQCSAPLHRSKFDLSIHLPINMISSCSCLNKPYAWHKKCCFPVAHLALIWLNSSITLKVILWHLSEASQLEELLATSLFNWRGERVAWLDGVQGSTTGSLRDSFEPFYLKLSCSN